jgi:cysteinyl-tRNA synthetase
LTQTLVDKGFAYESGGSVYFSVDSFPEYGKLSGQVASGLQEGVRVETDPLKRDQRDFALWKAAEPGRQLTWPSPWGDGFPGWHIECSAMAAKHLGPKIDIHTGGVDNIFPHHEDEIAQSEAAFGHRHVNYWVHGQHLLVDGVKMAKSSGNTYTLSDLEARGFEPLAFRYLCATVHYRSRMNFTFASLRAAQQALVRLRLKLQEPDGKTTKTARAEGERLRRRFWSAAADDLGLPRALAIAWETGRSTLPAAAKRKLLTSPRAAMSNRTSKSQPNWTSPWASWPAKAAASCAGAFAASSAGLDVTEPRLSPSTTDSTMSAAMTWMTWPEKNPRYACSTRTTSWAPPPGATSACARPGGATSC